MHPWEKRDRPTSNHKEQVFNGNETLTDYKFKKAPIFLFKNSNLIWYNLRLTEFFSSCRPAARLHPAGLVRRPGRGDGDLFWGRLSCLLSGTLTNWPSWPSWLSWPWLFWSVLGEAILLAFRCFPLALITWLRQTWPSSLFCYYDGEATLLDYIRISWLAW